MGVRWKEEELCHEQRATNVRVVRGADGHVRLNATSQGK